MKKISVVFAGSLLFSQSLNEPDLKTSVFADSAAEESFMSCSDKESAKDEETEGNGENIKQNEGG